MSDGSLNLINNTLDFKELAETIFDATPLVILCWNRNYEIIKCNDETIRFFEISTKEEYTKNIFAFSPECQPNGGASRKLAKKYLDKAFKEGYCKFEWMNQKLNGELMPVEITLQRMNYNNEEIIVSFSRDLREIKANLAKMREADGRTQIMLDATPMCANFWDKDFNNIDCNQEAVNLFELTNKQEYLDRFFELSPEFQPCGMPSSQKALKYITIAHKEGYCKFEWMHQKLNGDPVPSEITLIKLKYRGDDVVVGYTRDLRELKAMLAKMREADERTQIMLDATPLCANFWDKDCNNIDCNQAAVNLFELTNKQEYLDRFFELSPEFQPCGTPSSEKALKYITTAFAEGHCKFEWMHQKLNGEPVPSEITLIKLKYREDDVVVGYTRDLRELKAMLADMSKVEEDLRYARDIAQESNKTKGEFLANMSHEVRTPMNGILGLLQLVLGTDLTNEQRDYLTKTEQSAQKLLRILNDILDFSKIDAGKLEMEKFLFDFEDIFTELKDIFSEKIKEKNIDFIVDTPSDIPKTLIGDSLRLKQVLLNLISNAIKFTVAGEVKVKVENIEQSENKVLLKFAVGDSGIGMSQKQVNSIFSPFTQADSSVTRKYGGTGLGLTISKNLVEMMNGNVWVESEVNKGSTFYFTAEFEFVEMTPLPKTTEPQIDEVNLKEVKPAQILLVEDNNINQIIAKQLLIKKGHSVDVANNGLEAIEMLDKRDYALVLMDIQMPIMDGLTATRKIRECGLYNDLPIIAMSAHAMVGDREKSIESGMNDHITKPIHQEVLYSTINHYLI